MAKNELHFKLFVLGDSTVGKTCLLLRYTEDKFTDTHLMTLGIYHYITHLNSTK